MNAKPKGLPPYDPTINGMVSLLSSSNYGARVYTLAQCLGMLVSPRLQLPPMKKLIKLTARWLRDEALMLDVPQMRNEWQDSVSIVVENNKKYEIMFSHTAETLADYCWSFLDNWNKVDADKSWFAYHISTVISCYAFFKDDQPPTNYYGNLFRILFETDAILSGY